MPTVQITVERRVVGSNELVPGTNTFQFLVTVGQQFTLPEVNEISHIPDGGDENDLKRFKRMFWTYRNAHFTAANPATINAGTAAMGGFTVTCWYVQLGGGGESHVITKAFSLTQNEFISDNCIESVDPAAAWDGNTAFPSPNQDITVTYKQNLGEEVFSHYWQFASGRSSNRVQEVAANTGTTVYVFYGPPAQFFIPDWEHIGDVIPDWIFIDPQRWPERLPGGLGVGGLPGGGVADPMPIDMMRLRDLMNKGVMRKGATVDPSAIERMRKSDLENSELEVDHSIKRLKNLKKKIGDRLKDI